VSTIRARFHLAFPVHDLAAARAFYSGVLGCETGRESSRWIDFDFHGHQITAHLSDAGTVDAANPVDGDTVPVRHFGLILARDDWEALAERLRAAGADFIIEPRIRFEGRPGEQATMFVRDPSGNALEFKSFASDDAIFAPDPGVA
jgi:extradiol dioxygenase family protein